MKKLILFISLSIFVLCSLAQNKMYPEGLDIPNASNLKALSQDTKFNTLYQKALKLNENRFKNINHIQVGDTVYMPNLNGEGFYKFVAEPAVSLEESISAPIVEPTENNDSFYRKIGIILLVFVLITFLIIIILRINNRYLNKNKNKKNGKTPIYNLSLISSEEKFKYFNSFLKKEEKIQSIEQGYLKRLFGKKKLKVKVDAKNGKTQNIYLEEGKSVTRIVISNQFKSCRSEYFCDLGALRIIKNSNIAIPANWCFEPYFTKKINMETGETLCLIDVVNNIDEKRFILNKKTEKRNIKKESKRKKKKRKQENRKLMELEELDKVLEVLRNSKHLKYKPDLKDKGQKKWKLILKIKPKN
ncbi:MAG: hypothetical protein PF488_04560 [Patescibacteria group bacterium]|jgi:hypothetical protein|nr:hypothetical protein [Patescibacteria group bacterium]